MNVKEIKTLVGIMEDSSLTALEIEGPGSEASPGAQRRNRQRGGGASAAGIFRACGRTGPGAGSRSGGVCRACPACRRRAAGRGQGERFL